MQLDSRPARLARFVVSNAIVLLVVLLAAEGTFRLLEWRPPGNFTNLRYENDPVTGPWLLPSQVAFFQTPCFRVSPIHINRFGMRDRERDLVPTGRRIALIGDSITQGLQVADEQTVSRRLESLLGGRAEALNFGVTSTGTSVQFLNYHRRVRSFRPDTVLVMFFAGNDLSDDLPALKSRADPLMAAISPYLLLDSTGELATSPRLGQFHRTSLLVSLASSSVLGQWAYHAYQRFRIRTAVDADDALEPDTSLDELYEEAWTITEQVLIRFHRQVRADGARFAVVLIPGGDAEEDEMAATRLHEVSQQEQFPLLDLSARFDVPAEEGDPHRFSSPCDPHWNARAHDEAAQALLRFLEEQRWIEVRQ